MNLIQQKKKEFEETDLYRWLCEKGFDDDVWQFIETVLKENTEDTRKETMKVEWEQHIDFLKRHKKVAKIAGALLYFSEMDKALKCSENWYKNVFISNNQYRALKESYKQGKKDAKII